MRHAKSAWNSEARTDFDRPLTGRGRRASKRVAAWLEENALLPDLILASPAMRVRETIERMSPVLPADQPVTWDRTFYGADAARWLEAIRSVDPSVETVLLVGHNPGLEDLAAHLSDRPLPPAANGKILTTAAVTHLEFAAPWHSLSAGSCSLIDLVRPRTLPDPPAAH